jgi:MoaA/NifB/PqqE/SkfB family radical SAM enzyme
MTFDDFDKENREEVWWDINREPHVILKRIEICITNRCTLKCKNCAALMQYYKNPEDFSADIVARDYKRIMELIDWTDDILIMGGEPFVHKDLYKIVNSVINDVNTNGKVGMVKVMTNGTIIPNEDLLRLFSANNVLVGISNYNEKSKNFIGLVRALEKNDVKFCIANPVWRYIEQLESLNEEKDEESRRNMRKECSTRCRSLSNGRFYLCSFLKSANELRAVPVKNDGWVNIYEDNAKELLARYLDGGVALPKACSWCSGNTKKQWEDDAYSIPVAEQVKEPLNYYVHED